LIQLIQLYEQETTATNQLAYVMSLKPGDLVSPADQLSPASGWELPLQATIDQALQLREEIKANLAEAESFGWSSMSQLNRYLPSVSVFGQSQYNSQATSSTASGDSSGSSNVNQLDLRNDIGLSFSWLLVDGGIDVARARSLQQQSLASQADADQERFRVALQVENSYATYRASSMVVDTARLQVKQSRKTVDFAIKAYNGSTTDATTFIQNIQNYLNAENSYSQSVRRYNTAIAALYRYSALWPQSAVNPLSARLSVLKTTKGK
jgi:outer membrane protein TolC